MLVTSHMMPLGQKAPGFALPDTKNSMRPVSYTDIRGKAGTVVLFICNHCPYVQHLLPTLWDCIRTYQKQDIGFVAINANDAFTYPQDGPSFMADLPCPCPYLFDETQSVAKAYHAACTPDFFVFDKADQCFYRGRFDSSTPGKDIPVTGEDLIAALDALLHGQSAPQKQHPSMGCNIKWKD